VRGRQAAVGWGYHHHERIGKLLGKKTCVDVKSESA
jgi:hypothetical protein